MFLQEADIDLSRFFLILTIQLFVSAIFFYLAFKVLKRNYNPTTLTLSIFYIFIGVGFILNVIFLPLSSYLVGYIIYYIAAFLIIFGGIFLVLFIKNLLNLEAIFFSKQNLMIMISYAILVLFVLFFPGGITISEKTEWTPDWSWAFFLTLCFLDACYIIIPTIILSVKLYKRFEDKNLKRKLRYFILGIIFILFAYYGLLLYNTWDEIIFKRIWTFLSLIVVPAGLLIYYGIGHNL